MNEKISGAQQEVIQKKLAPKSRRAGIPKQVLGGSLKDLGVIRDKVEKDDLFRKLDLNYKNVKQFYARLQEATKDAALTSEQLALLENIRDIFNNIATLKAESETTMSDGNNSQEAAMQLCNEAIATFINLVDSDEFNNSRNHFYRQLVPFVAELKKQKKFEFNHQALSNEVALLEQELAQLTTLASSLEELKSSNPEAFFDVVNTLASLKRILTAPEESDPVARNAKYQQRSNQIPKLLGRAGHFLTQLRETVDAKAARKGKESPIKNDPFESIKQDFASVWDKAEVSLQRLPNVAKARILQPATLTIIEETFGKLSSGNIQMLKIIEQQEEYSSSEEKLQAYEKTLERCLNLFKSNAAKLAAEVEVFFANEAYKSSSVAAAANFDELYRVIEEIGDFVNTKNNIYTAQKLKDLIEQFRNQKGMIRLVTKDYGIRETVERLVEAEKLHVQQNNADRTLSLNGDDSKQIVNYFSQVSEWSYGRKEAVDALYDKVHTLLPQDKMLKDIDPLLGNGLYQKIAAFDELFAQILELLKSPEAQSAEKLERVIDEYETLSDGIETDITKFQSLLQSPSSVFQSPAALLTDIAGSPAPEQFSADSKISIPSQHKAEPVVNVIASAAQNIGQQVTSPEEYEKDLYVQYGKDLENKRQAEATKKYEAYEKSIFNTPEPFSDNNRHEVMSPEEYEKDMYVQLKKELEEIKQAEVNKKYEDYEKSIFGVPQPISANVDNFSAASASPAVREKIIEKRGEWSRVKQELEAAEKEYRSKERENLEEAGKRGILKRVFSRAGNDNPELLALADKRRELKVKYIQIIKENVELRKEEKLNGSGVGIISSGNPTVALMESAGINPGDRDPERNLQHSIARRFISEDDERSLKIKKEVMQEQQWAGAKVFRSAMDKISQMDPRRRKYVVWGGRMVGLAAVSTAAAFAAPAIAGTAAATAASSYMMRLGAGMGGGFLAGKLANRFYGRFTNIAENQFSNTKKENVAAFARGNVDVDEFKKAEQSYKVARRNLESSQFNKKLFTAGATIAGSFGAASLTELAADALRNKGGASENRAVPGSTLPSSNPPRMPPVDSLGIPVPPETRAIPNISTPETPLPPAETTPGLRRPEESLNALRTPEMVTIKTGDTLWHLTNQRYASELQGIPHAQRDAILSRVFGEIQASNVAKSALNLRSGNVNQIFPKENLNFSDLHARLQSHIAESRLRNSIPLPPQFVPPPVNSLVGVTYQLPVRLNINIPGTPVSIPSTDATFSNEPQALNNASVRLPVRLNTHLEANGANFVSSNQSIDIQDTQGFVAEPALAAPPVVPSFKESASIAVPLPAYAVAPPIIVESNQVPAPLNPPNIARFNETVGANAAIPTYNEGIRQVLNTEVRQATEYPTPLPVFTGSANFEVPNISNNPTYVEPVSRVADPSLETYTPSSVEPVSQTPKAEDVPPNPQYNEPLPAISALGKLPVTGEGNLESIRITRPPAVEEILPPVQEVIEKPREFPPVIPGVIDLESGPFAQVVNEIFGSVSAFESMREYMIDSVTPRETSWMQRFLGNIDNSFIELAGDNTMAEFDELDEYNRDELRDFLSVNAITMPDYYKWRSKIIEMRAELNPDNKVTISQLIDHHVLRNRSRYLPQLSSR